ncbi:hypothetical protein [Caulobacter endophyticus]|uniref:hypothetical protein n=1 Tax=Caulobacter endophyticus TaxID=2172652 RepID=UPI00130486F2|nr:hypothetical protein [Caulobacter endophyticus]
MSAKNTTRLDPARQLLTPACFKKQTFVAGPRRPVPPAFPVAARKKTVHTYLQRSPAASDFATFKCADTSRDNLRHSRQRGGA